jgi:manganese/zinc/iron transport system ATP- binding protein
MVEQVALEVNQLTVNYDEITALRDITLTLPKGKCAGVIGPNGAGKSTLLKASLGMLKPLSGTVKLFGEPLKSVRERVAYVPQRESVDWSFPITVADLVLMGCYGRLSWFKRPTRKDREKASYYLDLVGMSNFSHRQIQELSGGQQQRAFIARALLQEADIYLMDEPFAGIDCATEHLLMDIFKSLQKEGKTILVVHHDLNTVPHYFDWVVMVNMHLVASGELSKTFNPESIAQTYGKSYVLIDEALKSVSEQEVGCERCDV